MKFKKKIIKMKHRRDLRGERGLKVELPIVVIRKRRRSGAAKIDAVGMMGTLSLDEICRANHI